MVRGVPMQEGIQCKRAGSPMQDAGALARYRENLCKIQLAQRVGTWAKWRGPPYRSVDSSPSKMKRGERVPVWWGGHCSPRRMKRAPRGWRVGTMNQSHTAGKSDREWGFQAQLWGDLAVRQPGVTVRVKQGEGIHRRKRMTTGDQLYTGGSIHVY